MLFPSTLCRLMPAMGEVAMRRLGLVMRLCFVALFVVLVVATPAEAQHRLAIKRVSVVDVTDGSVHAEQTVVVEHNRIVAVGPVREVRVPDDAQVINGSGGYLIPGLWDMHVHGTRRESTYPLYLANGVTGVREMFGPSDVRAFRSALAAKRLAVLRILLAGPIIDGSPPIWPGSVVVTTVEEARRAVIEQKERGVDFIKVYQLLPRDAYYAILAESARQGLVVAGHVPSSVTLWEAVAAGQKTVEHLTQVPVACSSQETRLRGEVVRSYIEALRNQVEGSHSFSPAKCQLLYAALIRNGVWIVPTMVALRSDGWRNDPRFTSDDRLRYFDADTRALLAPPKGDSPDDRWTDGDHATARELLAFNQKLVGEMFRAGVPILAGTDALNQYVFPGFSLHDELALLVESGMTPLAALQSATLSAATFMGRSRDLGSVVSGKLADLVLLDANPLEDISNTRRIRAVVADGRLFRRADLDRILAEVEAHASKAR
jgi:hypothetical protein